ncbi:MAG TPA: hypothetical protein VHK65_01420 [Candidatus Dormibacteraeota bacterium]|nr:hypothetical protein [Candidatus Dormibacteraeota bacterium]
MSIVNGDQDGLHCGRRGDEVETGHVGDEPIARRRRAECEGGPQAGRLQLRNLVEMAEDRTEQFGKPGEGKARFRGDPITPQ